ncbi:MAG: hypothetical protein MK193_08550 [Lentisphaeria bacterium]|nr:hypothetical protein [Lentisphaeria bacterium]
MKHKYHQLIIFFLFISVMPIHGQESLHFLPEKLAIWEPDNGFKRVLRKRDLLREMGSNKVHKQPEIMLVLDAYINRSLLIDMFIELGYRVDSKDFVPDLQAYIGREPSKRELEIASFKLLFEHWVQKEIVTRVVIEQKDFDDFYALNKKKFLDKEAIYVQYIRCSYDQENLLERFSLMLKVQQQLVKSEVPLETLAYEYGILETHTREWLPFEGLKEDFQSLERLQVGEFSEVIQSPGYFTIIKVLERRKQGYREMTERDMKLSTRLIKRQKTQQLIELVLNQYKKKVNFEQLW